MLSGAQLRFLSDVLVAIGQVAFASLIIPYFIGGFEQGLLISGLFLTIGAWITGLIITKNYQ